MNRSAGYRASFGAVALSRAASRVALLVTVAALFVVAAAALPGCTSGSSSGSNAPGKPPIRLIAMPDPVLKNSAYAAGASTFLDIFGTVPRGASGALPASAYTLEESFDGTTFNDTGLTPTLFTDGFFYQVINGGQDAFYRVIAEESVDKKFASNILHAVLTDGVEQSITIVDPFDQQVQVDRLVGALWDRDPAASSYAVFIANSPGGTIEWLVETNDLNWDTDDQTESLFEEGLDPLLANTNYLILVVGLDTTGWATAGSQVNRFTTGP
jgi:hypothetical protein